MKFEKKTTKKYDFLSHRFCGHTIICASMDHFGDRRSAVTLQKLRKFKKKTTFYIFVASNLKSVFSKLVFYCIKIYIFLFQISEISVK